MTFEEEKQAERILDCMPEADADLLKRYFISINQRITQPVPLLNFKHKVYQALMIPRLHDEQVSLENSSRIETSGYKDYDTLHTGHLRADIKDGENLLRPHIENLEKSELQSVCYKWLMKQEKRTDEELIW